MEPQIRTQPQPRTVILRVTFVAPLWGVLSAVALMAVTATVHEAARTGGLEAMSGLGAFLLFLVPALLFGYPVGVVVAFLTSLLLLAVTRQFGWSRRSALLTGAVPGIVLAPFMVGMGMGGIGALGTLATCLMASTLTWWSSLRRLQHGRTGQVARVFD